MNIFDAVILLLAAVSCIIGWQAGFLARGLTWVGLALGLYLGVTFSGTAVRAMDTSSPVQRLVIAVGVIGGASLIGQGLGLLVGTKISRYTTRGRWATADRVVGGLAGLISVLILVWMVTPIMVDVRGSIAHLARTSAIARAIERVTPSPPQALQALRHLVGSDGFPQVFNGLGASPSAGTPPSTAPVSGSVLAASEQSTVQVVGQACDLILEGSGFTAFAPDVVVTNAHVVAGEASTSVITATGSKLTATVVAFDPRRDVAILFVPGLSHDDPAALPLALVKGTVGDAGAVLGHPQGVSQIVVQPASISQEVDAVGRDLYDSSNTSRDVYVLAAQLAQGDSGGPLVNSSGQVIGVAFAIAPDNPDTAYALADDEVQAVYANSGRSAVSTGPCISG